MNYEDFFKPSTLEETSRKLREGSGKKKTYLIIWDEIQYLTIHPNELRESDDVLIEIEADIWWPFCRDMKSEIGSVYNLSRQELHDALEIYKNEYEQHWHEDGWPKAVLERISYKRK